jgi:hypothetical protein
MADGTLSYPRPQDYAALAAGASASERRQWEALTAHAWSEDACVAGLKAIPGPHFCLLDRNGHIYVAGGLEPVRMNTLECWMLATESGWLRYGDRITRTARRIIDSALKQGVARVQAYVLPERREACDWYARGLGMVQEGVHRRFFADGSDAVSFAKVR